MVKKCIVAGCIIIKDGKTLMLKHKKIGAWLPPGGHVEPEEFPYEAAIRETKEETGIDVELIGEDAVNHRDADAYTLPNPFAIVYERVPYKTQPMHIHFDMVYVGKAVGGSMANNEESTDMQWFGIEDVKKLDTLPNVKSVVIKALEKYSAL